MQKPEIIHRHSLATRLLHWINALSVFLVLMSGLQIFNADPHLYWGQFGASPDRALLSIGAHGFPHWATLPSGQVSDQAMIPLWGCYGIVAGVFLGIGGVLLGIGVYRIKRIHPLPEESVRALEENIQWLMNKNPK